MASTDEPRREMPRDLYPEWTTRPHAKPGGRYSAIEETPPVTPRLDRTRADRPWRAPRALAVLFLVFAGALLATFLLGRTNTRNAPADGPAVYATDARLEELARSRLEREAVPGDVTVVVREQIATASGRVPDERTRERVLNLLRMTPNVSGVIDHLTVGPEKSRQR